jgi:hypothetical protein
MKNVRNFKHILFTITFTMLLFWGQKYAHSDKVHDNSHEDDLRGRGLGTPDLEYERERNFIAWKKKHKREEALKRIHEERINQQDYIRDSRQVRSQP